MASRQAIFDYVAERGFTSVLEIGPGLYTDHRLHWGQQPSIRYEVVDVTPQIVAAGRERGIVAHHGAIEDLPFADGAFDFVYCRHVWEHCPHYLMPLTEMLRVAKHAAGVVLFRHKESGTDEINHGTYVGLENVYHNTYATDGIAIEAKALGATVQWQKHDHDLVGLFAHP